MGKIGNCCFGTNEVSVTKLVNLLICLAFIILINCNQKNRKDSKPEIEPQATANDQQSIRSKDLTNLHDTSWVNLSDFSDSFVFDLKYATKDNFLKEPVYKCSDCFLRYGVAKKLIQAEQYFKSHGYQIKLFDCYRPLSVQKLMWHKMPDPKYVANPNSSIGSYHNRGGAVDLTLTDSLGNELDMGTPFDHFGKKSHFDFKDLPANVITRRIFLREGMEVAGFNGIRTEWWHFSTGSYKVSDQNLCH